MLLYIHIPFCDSKCHYCAFNSYVDKIFLKDSYIDALLIQLKNDLVGVDKIDTVFIGGGTPSTINIKCYERIFDILKDYINKDTEITIEANPNSSSFEWLRGLRDLGVNRVSFGVQSFDNKKLKFLGRNHKRDNAINSIENAYRVGFENISIDIIYNTSIDSESLLKNDLDMAFTLPINHISMYSLTIEDGTKFESNRSVYSDNLDLTNMLFNRVIDAGFTQYEISNFGKYQSKHNLGYWQYREYLGVGAGAVGFRDSKRTYPISSIEQYIQNPLYKEYETLSSDDIKSEKVLLGLRSIVGVELDVLDSTELDRVKILIDEDRVFIDKNRVFNRDFLLSDEVALFVLG